MLNQVNPMLQKLTQVRTNNVVNNISQFKQAVSKLSTASNRNIFNTLANQIIVNNPILKPYVQKYGMDFMKAFQEEAKIRGVNPDEILNALR